MSSEIWQPRLFQSEKKSPDGCLSFRRRAYRDLADLQGMVEILIEGRKACTSTYYVHVGDLIWWLFYFDNLEAPEERIVVWENEYGEIAGWNLFSRRFQSFDVFLHPQITSPQQKKAIYDWAENELSSRVRLWGGDHIHTMWVSDADVWLQKHLTDRGFKQDGMLLLYLLQLDVRMLTPDLPSGFQVYRHSGLQDVHRLAALSHAAFASRRAFPDYLQNYHQFLSSPAIETSSVWVSEAADNRLCSFCIAWQDSINRSGYIEPCGTHPEFHRRGLGKAVLLAAMQHMKVNGLETASICVDSGNRPARRLYESIGFTYQQQILSFSRKIL